MALINFQEVLTPFGYKRIELHLMDLSKPEFEIDCLVISAFKGNYSPTEGTLIHYLEKNNNVFINELAKSPEIDLKNQMNVWLSKELNLTNIKRIACVEIRESQYSESQISKSIKNLFSMLSMLGNLDISIKKIAIPLIGTGSQRLSVEQVLSILLDIVKNSLNRLPELETVIFGEVKADKKLDLLDDAINKYFKREKGEILSVPNDDMSIAIKKDILNNLKNLKIIFKNKKYYPAIDELEDTFSRKENPRFFELSFLGRKIVECIVDDILKLDGKREELYKSIRNLKDKNIAEWILSYLHMLRSFGNRVAHEKSYKNDIPDNLDANDLISFLFCLNRVLEFWVFYKSKMKK